MVEPNESATCPSCRGRLPSGAARCPGCGTRLDSDSQAATQGRLAASDPATEVPPPPEIRGAASAFRTGHGFAPGTLFAGRYRIVALLGRGGMGEVYRADDLKLGQSVALKLLPPRLAADRAHIEAFHAEVRNARQISHPNVCRVHDIGEHDGQHFLSMEYVDGEDLASLLTRIGHLPQAKALEIAHQLCAGLQAAHDRSVVHRDLKPANVMLDGHGQVRITDFGLAIRPVDGDRADQLAGTPMFMAPEQFSGAGASPRSDLYALGLVLYEVFTGARPFAAAGLADIARRGPDERPVPVSSHVPDVDPAIGRAIERCLEHDPARRPASARELSALLPGGDPLATALAAGATPSPAMVAAAGDEERVSRRSAWRLAATFGAALAICVALAPHATLLGVSGFEKSPVVLADRSREICSTLGLAAPADSVSWLEPDLVALRQRSEVSRAESAVPGPSTASYIRFRYRQSPEPLVSVNPLRWLSASNPPMVVPGMASLLLDARGRLLRLEVVPEVSKHGARAAGQSGWEPLFTFAGLDPADFTGRPATLYPAGPFDVRASWIATPRPGRSGRTVVHGAAFAGTPVLFAVETAPPVGPAGAASGDSRTENVLGALFFFFLAILLATGGVFARRNLRSRSADTRGALRVASLLALSMLSAAVLREHLAWGTVIEFYSWIRTNGASALWSGTVVWMLYVALEPFARRHFPHSLIGWTRLLAGHPRDSRVGWEILVGSAAGALIAAVTLGAHALPGLLGRPTPLPHSTNLAALAGPLPLVGVLLATWVFVVFGAMFLATGLAVGQAVFRRRWLAFAAAPLLVVVALARGTEPWLPGPVRLAYPVFATVLMLAVFARWGLLAVCATGFTSEVLANLPICIGPDQWYAGLGVLTVVLVAAVAAYGLWATLPRQRQGRREPARQP